MTKQEFIEAIAGYVKKYAPEYGICVYSPIIAQGILESGWGESRLAKEYHNYFGLKCGTKWTGKSVNLSTQEEYSPGTLTTIKDNFRVYDSMEEGVKGYFEFIQLLRYQNLRGITDPEEYLETIRADGYATSSTYVQNNMALVRQYNLTEYDAADSSEKETEMSNKTADALLAQARAWIGCRESDGSHRKIIDIYNAHKPLARGYAVKYTDAWCATFVSACAIKTGMTDIIPTECGCGPMIQLFKNLGEWDENDARVPNPGDIIFYDWQDSGSGDNTGNPDHVGIVEKVSGGVITVIEGNNADSVKRRNIRVNGRYIRGYGVPKYQKATATTPSTAATPAGTVLKKIRTSVYADKKDSSLAGTYVTTADLYCRNDAGVDYKALCIIPKGTSVKNYGYYSVDPDTGRKWLLIQFTLSGVQYTGFSSIKYMQKQ